jgi:hypothetical protein
LININSNEEELIYEIDNKDIQSYSLIYFIAKTEIYKNLKESIKIFIIEKNFHFRKLMRNNSYIFNIYIECLLAMNINFEIFSEFNLFDIYIPEQ